MKIAIMLNAVVYNRGSEALIRGLGKILKEKYNDCEISLISSEDNFGDWLKIDNVDYYIKKISYEKKSIYRYIIKILEKVFKFNMFVSIFKYKNLIEQLKKQDVIFVIGADNYDITYSMQDRLKQLNSLIKNKTNAKMILYDCSIATRDITEILKQDLENFDYITIRESISETNIKNIINGANKLHYFPDPAFVMEMQETKLPVVFERCDVIGINVSDLILKPKYGGQQEKILKAYKNMMDYILKNTNLGLVLIPHVMNNADLSALKILYEYYKDDSRVSLVEDEKLNARELKYIISKCSLYIGARTHSTIAAYSSNVPTIVLGYSVKSEGIAKDIFGEFDQYVLPVANLDSEEYLVNGFKWLYQNKEEIKKTLENKMPEYIESAKGIAKLV